MDNRITFGLSPIGIMLFLMTNLQTELLRLVDPLRVRMISIDGCIIRIIVDGHMQRFEFNSDAEARAAFEDWIKLNPEVERA